MDGDALSAGPSRTYAIVRYNNPCTPAVEDLLSAVPLCWVLVMGLFRTYLAWAGGTARALCSTCNYQYCTGEAAEDVLKRFKRARSVLFYWAKTVITGLIQSAAESKR